MQQGQSAGEQSYELTKNVVLPVTSTVPAPNVLGWRRRLQDFLIGKMSASVVAARIESPLRVAPQQIYKIRIQITGRDEAEVEGGGLSSLGKGDVLRIQLSSAIDERYNHVSRQIAVEIPEAGKQLEVAVPLLAVSESARWRNERIHIHFLDGANQPLYEKPFVLELFISSFVTPGKEGYSSVPIPF